MQSPSMHPSHVSLQAPFASRLYSTCGNNKIVEGSTPPEIIHPSYGVVRLNDNLLDQILNLSFS